MRSREHNFGRGKILGENLIAKGQGPIRKCLPQRLGVLPYLLASAQCAASRQKEFDVESLVGEIRPYVSGVGCRDVALKDVFCRCPVLVCHRASGSCIGTPWSTAQPVNRSRPHR
jgi:hypothetical protein